MYFSKYLIFTRLLKKWRSIQCTGEIGINFFTNVLHQMCKSLKHDVSFEKRFPNASEQGTIESAWEYMWENIVLF